MLLLRDAFALLLVPFALAQNPLQISSPDGQIAFTLFGQDALQYSVIFRGMVSAGGNANWIHPVKP